MMIEPGHSDKTYLKARREFDKYKRNREESDPGKPVWVKPVRTASGCRFGYWRKAEDNDET